MGLASSATNLSPGAPRSTTLTTDLSNRRKTTAQFLRDTRQTLGHDSPLFRSRRSVGEQLPLSTAANKAAATTAHGYKPRDRCTSTSSTSHLATVTEHSMNQYYTTIIPLNMLGYVQLYSYIFVQICTNVCTNLYKVCMYFHKQVWDITHNILYSMYT